MLSPEICIKLRLAGLKQYQPRPFDTIYVRFRDQEEYRIGVVVPTKDPSLDGHLIVTERGAWPLAAFVDHLRIPSADSLLTALWDRDEAAHSNTTFESYCSMMPGHAVDCVHAKSIQYALAQYYIKLYGKQE